MAFQLSHTVWIAQQVNRCRGVLLQNMDPKRQYTLQDLLSLCADFGLDYTMAVYQEIGQALLAEGFLETV